MGAAGVAGVAKLVRDQRTTHDPPGGVGAAPCRRPTSAAAPVATPGATAAGGVEPYLTPNADFYRIDTALSIPNVDPDTWRLKIGGMVDNPIELTYDELLARPMVERIVTLACVSNEVGGDLVGNARLARRAAEGPARRGRRAARRHPGGQRVRRRLDVRLPHGAWRSTAATPWWPWA